MREDRSHIKGFGKDGHLDENGISLYVDYLKGLATVLPEEIRDHVAGCTKCRQAVMEVTDLLDRVEEPAAEYVAQTDRQPPAPPQGQSAYTWQVIGRIVAGLAAGLVLAWFIHKMLPDHQPATPLAGKQPADSTQSTISTTSTDSTSSPISTDSTSSPISTDSTSSPISTSSLPDTIRYARAFIPDPAYENLIVAHYRSSMKDPELEAPPAATRMAPGDTLRMHWKPQKGEKYLVRIVDNHEKEIVLIQPASPGEIVWVITLKPGRYYWKFEGEEELYKVGSVLVERM